MSKFHYPISASTSEIWTKCTAAPWMAKLCKQPEPSDAMERGTRIHEIAEKLGNGEDPGECDPDEYAYASRYMTALQSVDTAPDKDGVKRWDHEEQVYAAELAGTMIDAVLFGSNSVHIVDLKTGQMPVDPRNNQQLIFAAACMHYSLPTKANWYLGIYQELDDGTPPMRWWCPTHAEITAAVADMRAKIAAAEQGGTPTPGDHCKRCRGKGACGAYKEVNERNDFPRATTISPKEAAKAMRDASESKEWHESVRRTWTSAAQAGQLPGVYTTTVRSALRWVKGRDLPGDWLVKVPKKPNQVITSRQSTEEEMIKRGFAVRPPPQVRVKFEGCDEPEELKEEGF